MVFSKCIWGIYSYKPFDTPSPHQRHIPLENPLFPIHKLNLREINEHRRIQKLPIERTIPAGGGIVGLEILSKENLLATQGDISSAEFCPAQ